MFDFRRIQWSKFSSHLIQESNGWLHTQKFPGFGFDLTQKEAEGAEELFVEEDRVWKAGECDSRKHLTYPQDQDDNEHMRHDQNMHTHLTVRPSADEQNHLTMTLSFSIWLRDDFDVVYCAFQCAYLL